MKSRSASKTRPKTTLPIKVYASAELLQRIEDVTARTGLTISRSGLICVLLDAWATIHGCPQPK